MRENETRRDNEAIAREVVLLSERLTSDNDRAGVLQDLVDLVVTAVDGCAWAGITWWPYKAEPRTLAASGQVARDSDRLQYQLQEGPCLTAAAEPTSGLPQPPAAIELVRVEQETRWPRFVAALREHTPVRCVLSFPLGDQPERAALNLYSDQPDGFDNEAITDASLFAARASMLLLHAHSSNQASTLARALESNRQIGIAMGILMCSHHLTEEQAFQLLVTTSQRLNRKLRDIAADITLTGALPPTPGTRAGE